MEREHGTKRRIRCGVITVALGAFHATEDPLLDVEFGGASFEERKLFFQDTAVKSSQRRVVIEHVESASKGRANQIVFASLDLQIAKRDDGCTGNLDPVFTRVSSVVNTKFCPEKHQFGHDMILNDPPDECPFWQVTHDWSPRSPSVSGANHIRIVIARFMIIHNGVNRVGIMEVGLDVVDEKSFGDTKNLVDASPI